MRWVAIPQRSEPPTDLRQCALEIHSRADDDDPRVRAEADIIGVENTPAGADDVLKFRLQRQPWSQLRFVHDLDHRIAAAHRIEEVSEQCGVGIQSARAATDSRVRGSDADLVVGTAPHQALVEQAAIRIEADQVAVARDAAGAKKSGKALVVGAGNATERLINHAVDALIAGMLQRDAGRLWVCEREAGVVEALISEMRAGVVPHSDAVGAGKSGGVLTPIRAVARLCDDKGPAAKAEHRPGWKWSGLIGAVAAAGIAAEHRGLELDIVARFDAHANAGGGQRIGGSRGRQIGGEKGRPTDAVVDEVGCSLALQELAVRQHQTGTDRPEVVGGVLLVPERIEPPDGSCFEIRYRQDVAEIVRTEERTMGDEPVDVDSSTLPPHKLFQIEVDLWLEDP